jgi:dUTP pyrophosphatase
MKIKIIEGGKMPVKMTEGAACFDVFARDIEIKGESICVELGFATEFDCRTKGIVIARSSLAKTGWVIPNSIGIIDSDYRGEWKAYFTCLGDQPFPYKEGDRVAQIYFDEVLQVKFFEVEELSQTDRGVGGYGSTGN